MEIILRASISEKCGTELSRLRIHFQEGKVGSCLFNSRSTIRV